MKNDSHRCHDDSTFCGCPRTEPVAPTVHWNPQGELQCLHPISQVVMTLVWSVVWDGDILKP